MSEETETNNPHAIAEKKTTAKSKTAPKKAAPKLDTADVEQTKEERMAELASTTEDGRTFTWPVETVTFNEAMQLSMDFQKANLKPGQSFSINPHRNVFFFLPECGISLNTENYTWTYTAGALAPDQMGYLIHAVRSCDLLVGDIEIKINKPKPSASSVDCQSVLARPLDSIRATVQDILSKRQSVKTDGSIVSPGIELKALLKYETSHENRQSIKKLLNSALNRIGGMVEFLNQFDDKEDVGARKIVPIPSQGGEFVNKAM